VLLLLAVVPVELEILIWYTPLLLEQCVTVVVLHVVSAVGWNPEVIMFIVTSVLEYYVLRGETPLLYTLV
jgi:hypothetical protein